MYITDFMDFKTFDSLRSIRNSSFGRVVGCHLKLNPIARHDTDKMNSHFPR